MFEVDGRRGGVGSRRLAWPTSRMDWGGKPVLRRGLVLVVVRVFMMWESGGGDGLVRRTDGFWKTVRG